MGALNYWHTLRHLRPVQIYGRAWFRLARPRPDLRPAPHLRERTGSWQQPVRRPTRMEGVGAFCFLNQRGVVDAPSDWNAPDRDKLWLYNLHYFDDLTSAGARQRLDWHRSLIARWISENLPGQGNGWEPYPLSLRIVNWIKWGLAGNHPAPEWTHSLAVQTRYLRRRLEWHLLGNHLFVNAKALIFAGVFFEGREADGWREKGLAILAREEPEQVLPDGGHFELSPMYHGLILEDLADLINLSSAYPGVVPGQVVEGWKKTVQGMRHWLLAMTHTDGQIAFFNDAALGISPLPKDLEAYARRLGLPLCVATGEGVTNLADTGYARVQRGEMVAILDMARVGPDYLPGHAHADTLSFEMSLFGQRVIVNSGISEYGTGPERQRQRSTAAHNTVEVDGTDSSEVWGGFRVARRAKPFDFSIRETGDAIYLSCAHDGYRRLPGRVVHRREWHFSDRSMSVADSLQGRHETAMARYHLHSEVKVEGNGRHGQLILPEGQRITWTVSGGRAELAASTWHPEFGVSIPSRCLEVKLSSDKCIMEFTW